MRMFLGLVLVTGLVACAPSPPPLNVVVLTIDTCRADRLSCYGYDLRATPNIDTIAAEGVLFEEARTCVPITLPSHVSIMTGLYPAVHGVRENGAYVAADSLLTLAEILKAYGYSTAAFVGSFPLESRFNLDQGFEYYGDLFGQKQGSSREAVGGVSIFFDERPADKVNDEFFRWLENRKDGPFFAWLHYFDPHQPHDLRPPYDATCATRPYDGEIAFVDECVGRLRGRLEKGGLLERTIFVLTSDHGEGLGDHGEVTHALLLYDSTLRVPMIIRAPLAMGLSARVEDEVRTVDLLPTILELLGFDSPTDIQGTSMADLMRGEASPPRDLYAETFFGKLHFRWSVLAGYQSGKWKYIHGPKPQLYNVADDPSEEEDVLSLHPETGAQLRDTLFALLAASGGGGHSVFAEPDRETEIRLKALGYIGSWEEAGEAENWFAGANPVDMMGPYQLFNTAKALVHQGQWLQAVQMFRLAVDADPNNTDARVGLVHALIRNGDILTALREAEGAVALYPDKGEIRYTFGSLLLSQLRPKEALEAAQQALRDGADPVSTHMLIGKCAQLLGDHDRAVRSFHRALELDESQVQARIGLGQSLAGMGRTADAEAEFRLVLSENPYWAPAHYNFGVFLMNREEFQEAVPYFQKAIRISPTYAEPHHGLAVVYYESGRILKAQEHLEEALHYADDAETQAAAQALREEIGRRE